MTATAVRLRRPSLRLPRSTLAAAALGGLVLASASPPFDVVPAVFAGLAVLAGVAWRSPTARAAFVAGTVFGTVAGLVGMRFIPVVLERFADWGIAVGVVATVLVAVGQALAWGGAAAVTQLLVSRGRLPLEVAFAVAVFVACAVPGLFGWTPAALLLPRPELVQLAEVVGERGVSAVVAVIAALLARAALAAASEHSRIRVAAPALVLAMLAVVALDRGGAARMDAVAGRDAERLRVALVDHRAGWRVDPPRATREAELRTLRDLSQQADARGAELVVWPEGAYPFPLERPLQRLAPGGTSPVARGARAPRLIGLRTYEDRFDGDGRAERARRNSAVLVDRTGHLQGPYDKVRLLWFGERMPLGEQLPFLQDLLPRGSRLEPGTQPVGLTLTRASGTVRLGLLTCYEDMLTGYGRRTAREVDPALLVGLSNNSWFSDSVAVDWQERLSSMRAVELRTDFVRAVNRGVTTWVDASGRMRLRHASDEPAVQVARPALRPAGAEQTLYVRLGDGPLWVLAALVAAAAVWRRGRAG